MELKPADSCCFGSSLRNGSLLIGVYFYCKGSALLVISMLLFLWPNVEVSETYVIPFLISGYIFLPLSLILCFNR